MITIHPVNKRRNAAETEEPSASLPEKTNDVQATNEEAKTADAPKEASAKVIAVVNQKGGVGKTTTAINLGASLALEGIRTLLIDCDPQANTTGGLGARPKEGDEDRLTVYDLFMDAGEEDFDVEKSVVPTDVANLSLVPGSKNLIGANLELVGAERREFRLRDAIEPLKKKFTFILLDCPPALDLLTLNALVAADGLLVPMQAEYFALEGISELMSTLDKVSAAFNDKLALEGVLLTMYDERTNLAVQVTENLRAFFNDKLLKTTIPRNVRLAEAPSHGKPVATYDSRSRGAEAYRELALEVLGRNGMESPEAKRRKIALEMAAKSLKSFEAPVKKKGFWKRD